MKGAKPVNQNWQGYLIEIDNVIASMPHKLQSERDKRAPFKEASGFSMSFKEAWRNPGTHDPKKTYTRNEALEVIAATKAFMNAAAIKIFKVKMV